MAYIKYKEITKYFNFSSTIDKKRLPKYVNDYVFQDEIILASYKTSTDHGIFTDKKIVLFDNYSPFGAKKTIYTIPYDQISTCSVIFYPMSAELSLFLDCGYPVRLKFIKMKAEDKLRLRLLYSAILKIVCKQTLTSEEKARLVNDNISFERDGEKNG